MTSRQLDEEAIFHVARAIPSLEARTTYLDQICAGDQALRERVEALLKTHEQEHEFLKSSEPSATAESPAILEKPGQRIGRYKLLQKIGEGGFGVVYMAEQVQPVRRKVALKIIKPGMDTHAVIARFEAERQALALMDHPHIARVLDGGATETGRPYFVMELVKGIPITDYCDNNQMSTEERLDLFRTVCQAVQHAHHKGIIHRDIKPSNVLVTLADGQPIVKVIDFGVAKATNQQLTEKTLFTAYGQMVGTPQYMSPEQAEMSCLDVDTRSDVYSLGVMLYELLTSTTPFEAERLRTAGYAEMRRIICEEEPPKPSTRLSTSGDKLTDIAKHRRMTVESLKHRVQGDLDWIVMKALEKDRNRRYQSAGHFAHDIENLLTDHVIDARPPSMLYRVQKTWRRNRVVIAAGVLLSVFLLSTLLIFVASYLEIRDLARSLQNELVARVINASANGEIESAMQSIDQLTTIGAPKTLTDTLTGIAYAVAGESKVGVDLLKPLSTSPDNALAQCALVWTYYDAGDLVDAAKLFGKLRNVSEDNFDLVETDLCKFFLARFRMYAPGDANDYAIRELSDVITHNRLWGIAYTARAEAYLERCHKTKSVFDLKLALRDDQVAALLIPQSPVAKNYSLKLHLQTLQFDEVFPGEIDELTLATSKDRAAKLASEFKDTLASWDGAAHALGYYRFRQQHDIADKLEAKIAAEFAHMQTIRDGILFAERNLDGYRSALEEDENPFTRQMYALLLYEDGQEKEALEQIEAAIESAHGNLDSLMGAINTLDIMGKHELRSATVGKLRELDVWDVWWYQTEIVDYICGEKSAQEILADAHPFSDLTAYTHFVIGCDYLREGDRQTAREHFQQVHQTGRIGWGAHLRAKVFLQRMDQDESWPAWIPRGDEENPTKSHLDRHAKDT